MAKKQFREPVNEVIFKEHPVINRLEINPGPYDVTGKDVATFDFMDNDSFSFKDYSKALLISIIDYSESEIADFIAYQLSMISDKKRWLLDLETLIEKNHKGLNDFKPGLMERVKYVIKDFLNDSDELISPNEQRLIWKEDATGLLELVTALSESGIVTNLKGKVVKKDILIAFEKLFGMKINNPDQSSNQFKTRHNKHPVLDGLTVAFEQWLDKPKKK